jgi:hypothetical protein
LRCPNLELLNIEGTSIHDQLAGILAGCPKIRKLSLASPESQVFAEKKAIGLKFDSIVGARLNTISAAGTTI